MIQDNSKVISKSDDSAKDFIRLSLGQEPTRGFDVDCVYCEVKDGQVTWNIIELLRCITVQPVDSHPSRYWHSNDAEISSNKRKFLSLWALSLALRAEDVHSRFILVNYEDKNFKDDKSLVKVMLVKDANEESIHTKDEVMSFFQWQERFRSFNKNKPGTTWAVLEQIAHRANWKL